MLWLKGKQSVQTGQTQDERLAQTANEAHSLGTFGVPTFVVGNRIFWDNDRLVLVRHHLDRLARRT